MFAKTSLTADELNTDPNGAGEAEAVDTAQAGIQSLEVGMKLLTLLAEMTLDAPPPMLKSLAAAADMAPAKVHRYMVSFIRAEYVERDPATGRYRLGPMARQLGIAAIRRMDVVKLAGNRLPQVCSELQQSVALAIWTRHGPAIIATEDLRRPVTIGTRIGEVMPLLTSATGRVFGAWMPRPATQRLIEQELAQAAPGNPKIRTLAQVEKLFEATRAAGLGWTEGGLNATVNALAAPIFDFRGSFVAALAALGPTDDFDINPEGPLANALRAAVADISRELGYQS